LNETDKVEFLNCVLYLVLQSHVSIDDVEPARKYAGLKATLTPYVMALKGVKQHNLERLIGLTGRELDQSIILLAHLFKVGYRRKFEAQEGNPDKWWYWDLDNDENLAKIRDRAASHQ